MRRPLPRAIRPRRRLRNLERAPDQQAHHQGQQRNRGLLRDVRASLQKIHPWLEDFGLGYKRDDPSTIKEECLPIIHQKGLLQAYGFPHESFTWGVRSEPGVIGVFEKLFNTEDLLASFDAVNVSLPNRRDLPPVKPWAHQDQDPLRPGFRCIQGFVNLNPCGDNDGGLMVLKGGHLISKEYHETFKNEEQEFRWTNEMYLFTDTGLKWLEEKGLDLLGSQRKERGVPALST
ncbi:RHTO0S06e01178g1_1 [Rhodotorula toruloides]|uniref:RHTO0S06e01178g1_1 n=1 Tax=Rhodotorula toruloides TaxID=5286 RepID=A0A061AW05_RHOTO|nr:RHTO0S06e01178g1_1 [Rhodotorula toruloides]